MTELYTISNLSHSKGVFTSEIIFDPSHPVFAGHFPGKPIVPGVVIVEISAAVCSALTGKELVVKEASVIKFLQVIEPLSNPVVRIEGMIVDESDGKMKADLSFSSEDIIYAKLKGIRLTEL